jgi:hypothetical protein
LIFYKPAAPIGALIPVNARDKSQLRPAILRGGILDDFGELDFRGLRRELSRTMIIDFGDRYWDIKILGYLLKLTETVQ